MSDQGKMNADQLSMLYGNVKFAGNRRIPVPDAAMFPDDERGSDEIAGSHPFLAWIATYHGWGMAVVGRQVLVSARTAARFALRIENDGCAALGVQEADILAFTRMQWERAEIERRVRHDHVLSLIANVGKREIWISMPVSEAIAEKFDDREPPSLRIRLIRTKNDQIGVWQGAPKLEVPLTRKGFGEPEVGTAA